MSDGAHLLIPLAASGAKESLEARRGLALPHLDRLLARLALTETDAGDEHTLSMPHERVLARELGLPAADGLIPWAAWELLQSGRDPKANAWARITPCHWRVGRDHIVMDAPEALGLSSAESETLSAALRPYFEEDGIALSAETPLSWLAKGEVFRDLASASLDRVSGADIDPWLPRTPQARPLRKLQQEMQMLLYTHPLNEERIARGQLPVNSFWVSGAGALPQPHPRPAPASPASNVRVVQSLREATLRGDWPAWAAAWKTLDANEVAELLRALDAGQPVAITLCGERSAQTWRGQGGGWLKKIGAAFGSGKSAAVLDTI